MSYIGVAESNGLKTRRGERDIGRADIKYFVSLFFKHRRCQQEISFLSISRIVLSVLTEQPCQDDALSTCRPGGLPLSRCRL